MLHCIVAHPPAASYSEGAKQLARSAVAKAGTNKCRVCELFSDSAGYEFLSLTGEYFGSLRKEAALFLFDLSE